MDVIGNPETSSGQRAPKGKRPPFFVSTLAVSCLALGGMTLALTHHNRALNAKVRDLAEALDRAQSGSLTEGSRFPAISLLDQSGQVTALADDGEKRAILLFVSSTSCGSCENVRPVWNRTASLTDGTQLRTLELVLDADPSTLAERDQPYPGVVAGGDEWALTNKMPGVPAAILVDESGIVRRAFYGNLHAGLPAAVAKFLIDPSSNEPN